MRIGDVRKKRFKFEETEHGRRYKTPSKAIHYYCSEFCRHRRKMLKTKKHARAKYVYYPVVKFLVEDCPYKKKCPIWAYRLGKNPFIAKPNLTPEYRQKLRDRLNALWTERKRRRDEAAKKVLMIMKGKEKANEENTPDIP